MSAPLQKADSLMHIVEVSVSRRELSERMAMMRVWLDERRFEPSTFNCRDVEDSVLIRIEFKVASEAAAFAERFGGHLGQPGGAERDILSSALPRGIVG
jgi:hypothetical protein